MLEDKAEQLWYWKQLKTIYWHSIRRAFLEIGTYGGGEYFDQKPHLKAFCHYATACA